jgi:sugar phosphate isomerase/epimerase
MRTNAPPAPSLTRRDFCRASLASAVISGLGTRWLSAEVPGQRRLKDIGIIGGVPKDAGTDWQASLRRMAGFGYTTLEGGARGASPEDYLKFLQEIGLKPVSCGVQFGKQLAPDWLDKARALKVEYATTFWPWFHPPEKLTLDQLKEIAAQANRAGEQCRAAGLRFAVHNHDKEFREVEGKPGFEWLIELTDPKLVTIELDLYWVVYAGADPVKLFQKYPGRFELLHVKDMGPAPGREFVAVGAGTMDFARIFAHAEQAGVKYYIVELEGPANTTKAAEGSCRYLKQLRF